MNFFFFYSPRCRCVLSANKIMNVVLIFQPPTSSLSIGPGGMGQSGGHGPSNLNDTMAQAAPPTSMMQSHMTNGAIHILIWIIGVVFSWILVYNVSPSRGRTFIHLPAAYTIPPQVQKSHPRPYMYHSFRTIVLRPCVDRYSVTFDLVSVCKHLCFVHLPVFISPHL